MVFIAGKSCGYDKDTFNKDFTFQIILDMILMIVNSNLISGMINFRPFHLFFGT